MTRTTLSAALTKTDTVMTLASVTGLTAGMFAMIDGELVLCGSPDTTALTVPITRGQSQTTPTAHGNARLVAFGTASEFTNIGGFVNSMGQSSVPLFNSLTGTQMKLVTNAATATLKAGEVANGLILSDGTGGITLTMPTAALLLAALPFTMIGTTQRFVIRNTGTGTITVAAGTGGTVSGTATIATLNSKEFLIHWTGIASGSEAFTLYSLGTTVF